MRELCETRNSYETVLDGKKFICLPKELKDRGYQTVAVHNFTGAFFDRMQWYPKLGFDREIFMKEIAPSVHRLCGGPFRGPCDADVAQIIQQKLRDAKQPTFFYWMTLSTHVPIAPHEGTPRLDCAHDGGRIGHVEVCYMTELWMDMFQGVVQLARDLPDTEVLLVGDHAPPLWSKAGRELFTPGKVTWVRLAPKRAVQQAGR
jgi:phosphoglycerol transferase MdoB-like AlkP superfamily enzyme